MLSSSEDKKLKDDQIQLRRDFTKKLNLRRKVYRSLTSYLVYPLQEMAMKDLEKQLRDYLSNSEADSDSGSEDRRVTSNKAPASIETGRRVIDKQKNEADTELSALREQYIREFLTEKRNPSVPFRCISKAEAVPDENVELEECENYLLPCNVEHTSISVSSGIIGKELQELTAQQDQQPNSSKHKSHLSCQNSTLWSMEPRIFALETSSGKRRYVSSHLGRFMDHYWRECDVYNRHYYELIRESSPCRLYFDLEFSKLYNDDITIDIAECLLAELFDEVKQQFATMYSITINRHNLVDLDSSTAKKFSRHWIFHLPDRQLFSDSRAVGAFVKSLVARLEEEKESGELESKGRKILAKYMMVNADAPKDGSVKLTRFIDMGVYTRNRLFRLMGSFKFGKRPEAALRISSANTFPFPGSFNNAKFYLPEMNADDEKKCDAESDERLLDFQLFCTSHAWDDHANALECTLVVPAHSTKYKYPILPDPANISGGGELQKLALSEYRAVECCTGSRRQFTSRGESPFPKLDEFINTLGKRKGLDGRIGTFSLGIDQPLPRTISYNMLGNRWCENVGRAHKSNNIIWNVHLVYRVCWQCCHDPDCRGFRGKEIAITSTDVNTEIDEYFFTHQQADENEFNDPELEDAMRNINISNHSEKAAEEEEFEDADLEEALLKLAI